MKMKVILLFSSILITSMAVHIGKRDNRLLHSSRQRISQAETCHAFSVGNPLKDEFTSPNYPNNYPPNSRCTKVIEADFERRVMLVIKNGFHLEDSLTCQFDWLEVRDGPRESSPLIDKFCGDEESLTIYSTGRYMWLSFNSDDGNEFSGFKAIYDFVPLASQDIQSDQNQCHDFSVGHPDKKEFSTPNYPKYYAARANCTRVITAPPGHRVMIEFSDQFNIEISKDCEFDSLEIRDGPYRHSPLLGKWCGNETPPKLFSTGRFIWMKFTTDDVIQSTGFEATYFYV